MTDKVADNGVFIVHSIANVIGLNDARATVKMHGPEGPHALR
ncbi:MAG TPA: hypothetical protein VMU04_16650 [Candidatus Acidoferrum sp.]|nr:hypothetical protein [Candidatus Acidoferrum sp.]